MWGENWGEMTWSAATMAGMAVEQVPFAPWAVFVLGGLVALLVVRRR